MWWEQYYEHLLPNDLNLLAVRRDSEWRRTLLDTCNVKLAWHSSSSYSCSSNQFEAPQRSLRHTDNSVHVAMTYVEGSLDASWGAKEHRTVSRSLEAYTSLMSLAYYRTCPVTVHIMSTNASIDGFKELHQRYFANDSVVDPKWWHATDSAVNLERNSSPLTSPPPLRFEYINLNDHPVSAYLFNQDAHMDKYMGLKDNSQHRDSLLKLVIERVLPSDLHRVMHIDFDTLIVRDICEVWREVWSEMNQRAKETGVRPLFGITPNMDVDDTSPGMAFKFPSHSHSLAPERFTGINIGVIAVDLQAAREENWDLMWIRGVLSYAQAAGSTDRMFQLYKYADQNILNVVLKKHPEKLCLLSNDYNFQIVYIGHNHYNHDPPGLLRKVMLQRGHSIAILHGHGEDFLHDHSIKRYLWLQFLDRSRFSPVYRKQKATPLPIPDELSSADRASRLSRENVVKYLKNWTGARQVRVPLYIYTHTHTQTQSVICISSPYPIHPGICICMNGKLALLSPLGEKPLEHI